MIDPFLLISNAAVVVLEKLVADLTHTDTTT